MSTSISEFARRKPTQIFRVFKELLKKYQKLSELDSDMDAEDFGIQRTSAMVLKDLEELFKVFKTGE